MAKTRSGLEELEWIKEPPPKAPSRNLYNRQAEQLRDKPGKWALIAKCPSKVAAYGAGNARRKKWGEGFEVEVRGQDVYARFSGEASTSTKRKSVKSASRKATSKGKKVSKRKPAAAKPAKPEATAAATAEA